MYVSLEIHSSIEICRESVAICASLFPAFRYGDDPTVAPRSAAAVPNDTTWDVRGSSPVSTIYEKPSPPARRYTARAKFSVLSRPLASHIRHASESVRRIPHKFHHNDSLVAHFSLSLNPSHRRAFTFGCVAGFDDWSCHQMLMVSDAKLRRLCLFIGRIGLYLLCQ